MTSQARLEQKKRIIVQILPSDLNNLTLTYVIALFFVNYSISLDTYTECGKDLCAFITVRNVVVER